MARGAWAVGGLLLVVLLPWASAKEVTLSGEIDLPGPLVVDQGDVLTVLPDARVRGVGPIEVDGSLVVRGAEVSVPILLRRNGTHLIEEARVTGGIEVLSGRLDLRNVTLAGHPQRALVVRGDAVVVGERVDLRENAGDAVYVQEAADVRLSNSTFTGNGRGATVFSAARFVVADSRFADNGQHVVIELGPWSRPDGEIRLERDDLGPVAKGPTALASVLLRHDTPLAEDPKHVRLEGNRIHDGRIGVRAEGRGLVVESVDDEIVDNEVGVWVQLATLRMRGAVLGNDKNVEGGGDLALEGVSYIPAATVGETPRAQLPWSILVIVGVLVVAGLGALAAPRFRRAPAPGPAPAPGVDDGDEGEGNAGDGMGRGEPLALSSIERRILEDIVAHPGSAQRAIADRLGYTRQALHYHVKKLEARGLVEKTVEGRETRCQVPPRVARALQIETQQKP